MKDHKNLSGLFKQCAGCTRDGVSAAILSHLGCFLVPMAGASFGVALGGAAMTGFMLLTSPLIAAGATYGLDRMRGRKPSAVKLAASAVIAFGIAAGIASFAGHDGHGDHHDHSHHSQFNGKDDLCISSPRKAGP